MGDDLATLESQVGRLSVHPQSLTEGPQAIGLQGIGVPPRRAIGFKEIT